MTDNRIRLLLADDHRMLCESMGEKLGHEPGLAVVGLATSTDEALRLAVELRPDVLLMDIDMPGMVSFEAARQIAERAPDTRVLFFSAFIHDGYIEQALRARARGYVSKQEPYDNLVQAIREAAAGRTYYSDEVRSRIVLDTNGPHLGNEYQSRCSTLSPRELEVLGYIARGLSTKDIAHTMHVSPRTADNHTTRLMSKLDIHSRVELARFAIREGLAEA